MTRSSRPFLLLFVLALVLTGISRPAAAQESSATQQKPAATSSEQERSSAAAQGQEGAGAAEHKEAPEEENAEFKESASVRMFARWTGLQPKTAYWVLTGLNFVLIAALIYWLSRARVPEMFRARTRDIQKNLEEARRTGEEAGKRLAEIEERLAKLDSEIAALRAAAEADAQAEEERLRVLTEADQRKVVESAGQEIEAAAGQARRDLKSFAAELAVSLAEKRIKVDPGTDQALVRSFVDQLKDGK